MGFQTAVRSEQAFGCVGEFYDSSRRRATPYVLAAQATIGAPVWIVAASGKVTPTYNASTAKVYAGILVSPKEHIVRDASLSATLTLAAGERVEVADDGHIIIAVAGTASVGQDLYVLVAKDAGAETSNVVGDVIGADSDPSVATSTKVQTWKKIGKCVRVGAASGETLAVIQPIV